MNIVFKLFSVPINKTKPSGQGLLEATLAIGLILIGLGAVLTLTLQNVAASNLSGQRIIAANLAREAIEVVRGIRDSNWLLDNHYPSDSPTHNWYDGLYNPNNFQATARVSFVPPPTSDRPGYFTLDFNNAPPDVDNVDMADTQLYRGTAGNNYIWVHDQAGDSGYLPTGFRRLLLFYPVCSNGSNSLVIGESGSCLANYTAVGLKVEARVSWQASGIFGLTSRKRISLVEYIYDWR